MAHIPKAALFRKNAQATQDCDHCWWFLNVNCSGRLTWSSCMLPGAETFGQFSFMYWLFSLAASWASSSSIATPICSSKLYQQQDHVVSVSSEYWLEVKLVIYSFILKDGKFTVQTYWDVQSVKLCHLVVKFLASFFYTTARIKFNLFNIRISQMWIKAGSSKLEADSDSPSQYINVFLIINPIWYLCMLRVSCCHIYLNKIWLIIVWFNTGV